MPAAPGFIGNLYSIQHSYLIKNVGTCEKPIIGCDAVIEIPVIAPLPQERTIMDDYTFNVVPCIEILGLQGIKFLFETNEGMTVMPIEIGSEDNPYTRDRTVFVLPCGTTGIKSCKTISAYGDGVGVQHSLTFGIMPPPYNYDNALFARTALEVRTNKYNISDLDNRVGDLESKTDNLKIVTHALNASFPYKELPKNSGKQTVNVEKGMLYFWAGFTYGTSPATVHSPKITVSDGTIPHTYTLSLNKSVFVTIDLLAATITAYVNSTGEIVQQLKIFNTVTGYKTIEFENFDDIVGETLTLFITGRGVE